MSLFRSKPGSPAGRGRCFIFEDRRSHRGGFVLAGDRRSDKLPAKQCVVCNARTAYGIVMSGVERVHSVRRRGVRAAGSGWRNALATRGMPVCPQDAGWRAGPFGVSHQVRLVLPLVLAGHVVSVASLHVQAWSVVASLVSWPGCWIGRASPLTCGRVPRLGGMIGQGVCAMSCEWRELPAIPTSDRRASTQSNWR